MARSHIAPGRIAPGPHGHWLMGSAPAFQKNPITFFEELHKNYGDVIRFNLGRTPFHLIVNPSDVKRIFVDNVGNYIKGNRYKILADMLGNGLITSTGDFWKKQRRLISPLFHQTRLALFVERITKTTSEFLKNWELKAGKGEATFDAFPEINQLTLKIIGESLFNVDLSDASLSLSRSLSTMLHLLMKRFTSLYNLPVWVPLPNNLLFLKSRKVIDDFVYNLIASRRKNSEQTHDLLQMLIEVEDADTQEKMSDVTIHDEAMTFLLAGHETTANALCWTLYLLAQNPQEFLKLQEEIDAVLGDKTPTLQIIPQLKRTKMIIEESLRLYPPAWFLGRSLVENDQLGGYTIPAKSYVFTSPYITQRSHKFWEHAEEFKPDRFEKMTTEDRHSFIYYPFGGGQRLCIGNNFALMELTLILAMMTQKFNWTLLPKPKISPIAQITLRPYPGLPLSISVRKK